MSSAQRNAARVLPDPVGATTSAWSPRLTASHAPAWAAVGCAKAWVNQPRVAGEKRASTSPTPCPDPGSGGVDERFDVMAEFSLRPPTDRPTPAHPRARRAACDPRTVRLSEFRALVDDEFGAAQGRALVRDHVVARLGHR